MPKWPNSAVAARNAQRMGAPRRVRRRRADVGAHHLRRDQHRGVTLDRLALQSVVAVAGPHPLGALEDGQVDAAPARRAALELDVGVAPAQLVEHHVQRRRLGVRAGAPVGAGGVDVVAVHVPLDEGDLVVGEEGVDAAEDLVVGGGVGEVDDELAAGRAPPRSRVRRAPSRDGPGRGRCRG